jgi:hypothetical protein
MRIRLTVDTVGLVWDEGRHRASTIPKGAILQVTGYAPQNDRMISAVWNQQDVMLFATDVHERGEPEIA